MGLAGTHGGMLQRTGRRAREQSQHPSGSTRRRSTYLTPHLPEMLFFHHPKPVVDSRPIAELSIRREQPDRASAVLSERSASPDGEFHSSQRNRQSASSPKAALKASITELGSSAWAKG